MCLYVTTEIFSEISDSCVIMLSLSTPPQGQHVNVRFLEWSFYFNLRSPSLSRLYVNSKEVLLADHKCGARSGMVLSL